MLYFRQIIKGVEMKKFLTVFFLAILVLSITFTAFAADMPEKTEMKRMPASSAKTPSGYPAGPIQKAERGFMNLAFGWSEIPRGVVDKTKASNPITGLLVGGWQGVCRAFARTVSGAADLATFPIGGYEEPAVLPDMPAARD
ncbi:MAG: exosortase system-associated protein, TIGR04073 family [Candidatus Omnitrophica bacterium]|nr:exosortase system-associated protein, TIGR04073 family [Candidatus Omnitrophota bacterium]